KLVSDDRAREAMIIHKLARVPYRAGRYAEAVRWINRGLRVLEGMESTEATRSRAQLMALLAGMRVFQGRNEEATRAAKWLIDLAEDAGDWRAGDPLILDALARAYYLSDIVDLRRGR